MFSRTISAGVSILLPREDRMFPSFDAVEQSVSEVCEPVFNAGAQIIDSLLGDDSRPSMRFSNAAKRELLRSSMTMTPVTTTADWLTMSKCYSRFTPAQRSNRNVRGRCR